MELGRATIEQWVEGDDGAFREIFRAACREVYWLAVRILQNEAAADDVVQETFLRIYRMRSWIDPTRPFRPLILRVAANCSIDALRALNRGKEAPLDEELEDPEHRAHNRVDHRSDENDRHERLRQALSTLPAGYRAVLTLKYGHDMSYTEIAAALQLTVSAVGLRLKRGKELLRRRMVAKEARK